MALTISQLVNDYGSYSGKTLVGIRGARRTVPGSGFSGIKGVPYDNITFIIKVNGTKYASSRWLSQQQNGNPYIHQTSVARIDLQSIPSVPIESIVDIVGGPKDMGETPGGTRTPISLKQGEKFAEVEATSKLTTDDAILSFINDLLSDSPDIKSWQTYGSFEPKPRPVSVPGIIQSPTGKTYEVGVTTPYGGTYNPELDMSAEYPGMEFQRKSVNLLGLSGEEAASVSIPKTSTTADVTEIEPEPIEIGPIEIIPLDFGDIFDDLDFGLGNINLGNPNLTMGNLSSVGTGFGDFNNAGLASFNALSNEGGLASVGLGSYNTDYSGQPLGAIFSDANISMYG